MGEIYTFTPRFPQAYCHLCGEQYKYIFGHLRGKEHKQNYKDYKSNKKILTLKDYFEKGEKNEKNEKKKIS